MDPTRKNLAADDLQKICESKDSVHLGLVTGMYEELEIGKRIDEHISQDFFRREVSVGQVTGNDGSQRVRICPTISISDATIFLWSCPPGA